MVPISLTVNGSSPQESSGNVTFEYRVSLIEVESRVIIKNDLWNIKFALNLKITFI